MSVVDWRKDGIERLIDRHAELCEFFDGEIASPGREAPILITPASGKNLSECLADLAEQALAAYQEADFGQDPRIFALKVALSDAILELAHSPASRY